MTRKGGTRPDVAVIGAGVIGLAVGWRCVQRGLRVRLYDPAPGRGASYASAGMLAPVCEAYFGETGLTRLLVESAARWPQFGAELAAATGADIGYRTEGTLLVALTGDDLAEVERLRAYQSGLGLPIHPLRPAQLREREPLLAPRLRGGAFAPEDRQVDPRRLVAALRAAVGSAGVPVDPRPVTDLSAVDAEVVVVAAGWGTAALTGLPVRPVKGQILRLRAPGGAVPGFRHVIRGYADGRSVYLVPRADGEVVVGATVEELSDATVTAGAVLDLLRAAVDLVPELAEYELAETCVGHRPGTPDNAPIVGWLEPVAGDGRQTAGDGRESVGDGRGIAGVGRQSVGDGRGIAGNGRRVAVATGHFRHGVVLAPVTADGVVDLVTTGTVPPVLAPFTARRFTGRQPAGPEQSGVEQGPKHPSRP